MSNLYLSLLIPLLLLALFIYLYLALRKEHRLLQQQFQDLASKLKSTAIKHGQAWEHFVPFMENYPGDKDNSVFLGMPIDFLSFGEDKIQFIEVKTGQSKLSEKQKNIKKLVEEKKVEWHELSY